MTDRMRGITLAVAICKSADIRESNNGSIYGLTGLEVWKYIIGATCEIVNTWSDRMR